MSIKIGTRGIGVVKIGNNSIKKIYSGTKVVFSKNLIPEIDFTKDWVINGTRPIITKNTFDCASLYLDNVTIPGQRYKLRIAGHTNDPNLRVYNGYGGATLIGRLPPTDFDETFVFVSDPTSTYPGSLQFDQSIAGINTITKLIIQEI